MSRRRWARPTCATFDAVTSASNLLSHARAAGLSPALAEALEREVLPRLDSVLRSAPELPPSGEEETELLTRLVEAYRPFLSLLLQAFDRIIDAICAGLDEIFDRASKGDPSKHRSLHHLEEALSSLVRVSTASAAAIARNPRQARRALPWTMDVDQLPDDLRPYLRGLLASLVGLYRIDGEVDRLAPWAWMARRETLKSEGLAMVALHELGSVAVSRPRRTPGGWKDRIWIADDFDAPLPEDIEDSFYDPSV